MIRCTATEPHRNAHASTEARRLRQIMGGPISPLPSQRHPLWVELFRFWGLRP